MLNLNHSKAIPLYYLRQLQLLLQALLTLTEPAEVGAVFIRAEDVFVGGPDAILPPPSLPPVSI